MINPAVEGCSDFGGGIATANGTPKADAGTSRSLMLVLAERVAGAEDATVVVASTEGALTTTGRSGNKANDGRNIAIGGAIALEERAGASTGAVTAPPITRVGSSATATAAAAAKTELVLRLDMEGLGES